MRVRLAAAASTAIILVGLLGAPVLPVMIGTTIAYVLLIGRSVVAR